MHAGYPYPLGTSWDGEGINFALFSAHAHRVDLCLFGETGQHALSQFTLPESTDHVWHGYLPGVRPGQCYGYRVFGPYQPELGHRFNHHKLLLDPYARQLRGEFRWSPVQYGFKQDDAAGDLSFDTRDNAHCMPKCVVVDPAYDWSMDRAPLTPWSETVIYETHVRGFTMSHGGIAVEQRGTFAVPKVN